MLSPTEGWAAGTFGILHYTGGTWERVTRPVAKPLHDIAMASPTEGWIGGSFQNFPPPLGLLLHYSGGQWEVVDSGLRRSARPEQPSPGVGSDLYAIQMVSPTEGWAVGALDTIVHLQGGAWARMRRRPPRRSAPSPAPPPPPDGRYERRCFQREQRRCFGRLPGYFAGICPRVANPTAEPPAYRPITRLVIVAERMPPTISALPSGPASNSNGGGTAT